MSGGELVSGQGTAEVVVLWTSENASAELCVTETNEEGCVAEEVCLQVDIVPLGINDQEHIAATIFPNPANHYVNLATGPLWQGGRYTVCDLSGRQLSEGGIEQPNFQLSLVPFSAGHYFIRLQNQSHVKTLKVQVRK